MSRPRLLAVPNLSEGRDEALIRILASAFARDATVLDSHSDRIHNRTVLTLAPARGDLVEALVSGAKATIGALDLNEHQGEHPRIGVLDVAPVVWLHRKAREEAEAQALRVAEALGELAIPVFLYGDLATSSERVERAYFRSGGAENLARRISAGDLKPDFGRNRLHPTAGATLVTARPPLAAFNLELAGASLAATREVANELRESGGGLPGVRAIGLEFGDRTQVSTNVHDPVAVPLAEVVARTSELARPHGGRVVAAEIVGLVPRAAFARFPPELPLHGFDPAHGVIEERLAQL